MLVGGVIEHDLGDDAQPARMCSGKKRLEFYERAVARIHRQIVGNVIAIVAKRRRIERHQPQRVDPELLTVIQPLHQPGKVADAIAIAVLERLDVHLVNDGVFEPKRIAHSLLSRPGLSARVSPSRWRWERVQGDQHPQRMRFENGRGLRAHIRNMNSLAASILAPGISAGVSKLLIVDDHPVVRHGLRQLIGQVSDITVCGEAANAQGALEAMRRHKPEVVLLDVSLPGTNGIELLKLMLAEAPQLVILMLSMHEESLYALRALRAGAKGYLMKQQTTESVVDALRKVIAGGTYTTSL